jgi:hypothetical protein
VARHQLPKILADITRVHSTRLLDEAATRQKKEEFMYKPPCLPNSGSMAKEIIMKSSEQTRFDTFY